MGAVQCCELHTRWELERSGLGHLTSGADRYTAHAAVTMGGLGPLPSVPPGHPLAPSVFQGASWLQGATPQLQLHAAAELPPSSQQ